MTQAKHSYILHTGTGGVISGRVWTNDNLDQGYPSQEAEWQVSYPNKEAARRDTGGTHYGANGCHVEVTLDGRELSSS